jgi:flagellar basal body P-ring formation protein FlgA
MRRALCLLWLACLLPLAAAPAGETAPAPLATDPLPLLADELAAHLRLDPSAEQLILTTIRPCATLTTAASDPDARLEFAEHPAALTPQMILRVRLTRADGTTQADTLVVRAALWREALYTTTPTARGDALTLTGVEIRRVDTLASAAARDALPPTALTEDYVLTRGLAAGRPLSWRDVARRPLVRKGQLVEVSATSGLLAVTMHATALEDAGRGEQVRLRNPESRRDFSGTVVADGRAHVRF